MWKFCSQVFTPPAFFHITIGRQFPRSEPLKSVADLPETKKIHKEEPESLEEEEESNNMNVEMAQTTIPPISDNDRRKRLSEILLIILTKLKKKVS